jgi:hemerythrin superfamily protein
MDATKLLKEDHDEVRKLFKEYQKTGERSVAKKSALFEQIREALTVHSEIEEEIFYPAVRAARSKDAKEEVAEAIEEHRIVKELLDEMGALTAGGEKFEAKMTVLIESVEHHADEEEKEMFKTARKDMSRDELEKLGGRMEARKSELVVA